MILQLLHQNTVQYEGMNTIDYIVILFYNIGTDKYKFILRLKIGLQANS